MISCSCGWFVRVDLWDGDLRARVLRAGVGRALMHWRRGHRVSASDALRPEILIEASRLKATRLSV